MLDKHSRRDVLGHGGALGLLVALGTAGCGKGKRALSCTDTSALTPADVQLRTTLAYVDVSTDPNKTCTQCQQFIASPSPDACGTCKVVKGPINPKGNCKSFVVKPT